MDIPKLNFEKARDREYNQFTPSEHAKVVKEWLFNGTLGHREIDREILLIDKDSRGFISMGILHYLGLKKEFKGLFRNSTEKQALNLLKKNNQDFTEIIRLVSLSDEGEEFSQEEIVWRKKDLNFDERYLQRLSEMDETDGLEGVGRKARKDQANLKALLFKKESEVQCALCHRILPITMLWVSHIKPRSDCSISERTDRNVVMPACKLGCDDLFEKRYLLVANDGKIYINNEKLINKSLRTFMNQYEGKKCKSFNELTSKYFDFRRSMKLKNPVSKKNKLITHVENLKDKLLTFISKSKENRLPNKSSDSEQVDKINYIESWNQTPDDGASTVTEEEAEKRWTRKLDKYNETVSRAPWNQAPDEDISRVTEEVAERRRTPKRDKPPEIVGRYNLEGVSLNELNLDLQAGKVTEQDALTAVKLKLTRKNMRDWSRKRWTRVRDELTESISNNTNKMKPKSNLLKEAYAKTRRRR